MRQTVNCADVVELVDAIAAGDVPVDNGIREHLETCPRCASALASARRIEAILAARPAPPAPAHFSDMVSRRISRERWRAEQSVDWLFNIAIAVGLAIVLGGVAALMNLQALLSAAGQGWSFMVSVGGDVARQAAPTIATYVAAVGLLMSTLGLWWWAERRLSL